MPKSNPKYDPSEFIVPPSVKNGQSERIQFRAQSGHSRAAKMIANSRAFPFGTDQDVFRWCVREGLHKLEQLQPDIEGLTSVLGQAKVATEIARDELYRVQFLELFQTVRNAVAYHVSQGETIAGKDLVEKIRFQVACMPEEPANEKRWKDKYLKELEQFDYLFQTKR